MQTTPQNKGNRNIIRKPGAAVKARIIRAGLSLGTLAKAAKVSQPCLSQHLCGARRRRATQLVVWDAFVRLTGERISLKGFWGPLLNKETAA